MAAKFGYSEDDMEMSRKMIEDNYRMKLMEMKDVLESEIKSLDLNIDINELMMKMSAKMQIFKAVQLKLMENVVLDKNVLQKLGKPKILLEKDEIENESNADSAYVESGRFSSKIPVNYDSKIAQVYPSIGDETAVKSLNAERKGKSCSSKFDENEVGFEQQKEDENCKCDKILKVLDFRERKLFSVDLAPLESSYDFHEMLSRLDPPSTVHSSVPFKKATTATGKEKRDLSAEKASKVSEKDNETIVKNGGKYETTNSLTLILQQLGYRKPKKAGTSKLRVDTFNNEYVLESFTGSPTISFASWLKKFEYSLAFVQIPPSDAQKLARLLARLEGAARLTYEEYADDVKTDYDKLTTALKASFTNAVAKRTAESALTCCFQQPDESVHDFSTRLTELVRTAMEGEPAATIKTVLAWQLKQKLRDDIKAKINIHDCTTFEEVLQKAFNRENYVATKAQYAIKSSNADANFAEKNGNQCYNCHKEGHFARHCTFNRRHRGNYEDGRHSSRYHPRQQYQQPFRQIRHYQQRNFYHQRQMDYYSRYNPQPPRYYESYKERSNSYHSKSPPYNDYRNPREHYTRNDRFADTYAVEREEKTTAEFFNIETETKSHQKTVNELDDCDEDKHSSTTINYGDAFEKENLVATSEDFGNDDDEIQQLSYGNSAPQPLHQYPQQPHAHQLHTNEHLQQPQNLLLPAASTPERYALTLQQQPVPQENVSQQPFITPLTAYVAPVPTQQTTSALQFSHVQLTPQQQTHALPSLVQQPLLQVHELQQPQIPTSVQAPQHHLHPPQAILLTPQAYDLPLVTQLQLAASHTPAMTPLYQPFPYEHSVKQQLNPVQQKPPDTTETYCQDHNFFDDSQKHENGTITFKNGAELVLCLEKTRRIDAPNFSKENRENYLTEVDCFHFELSQINDIFLQQISGELLKYLFYYQNTNPHVHHEYQPPSNLLQTTRLKTYIIGSVRDNEAVILIDKFCPMSFVTTSYLRKIDANGEENDNLILQNIVSPDIPLETITSLHLKLSNETNEVELRSVETTTIDTSFEILLGRDSLKLWQNKTEFFKNFFKIDKPLIKEKNKLMQNSKLQSSTSMIQQLNERQVNSPTPSELEYLQSRFDDLRLLHPPSRSPQETSSPNRSKENTQNF